MTSQEDYDKIVMQFQNLQETYEELLSYKVIVSKEDLKRYGVAGWDADESASLPVLAAKWTTSPKRMPGDT